MDLGTEVETVVVDNIMRKQKPEHCALLVYTVSLIFVGGVQGGFAEGLRPPPPPLTITYSEQPH